MPKQLTDHDGQTVWQAQSQVWGNTLREDREPWYAENQNLRFQGQYLDRETGLHYNTFRFYDPDIGRFTTPDPIGLAGGINLYQYGPNPIGWVDPWGLSSEILGANMASAGRPLAPGQTPHHAVKENANNLYTIGARKILTASNLSPHIQENGARLWGSHPKQVAQPGHPGKDLAKAIGNYHGGKHIHGKENDKLIYKILRSAHRKRLDPRTILSDITGRMEKGTWKKSFKACGG